jgi:hypothetical protein
MGLVLLGFEYLHLVEFWFDRFHNFIFADLVDTSDESKDFGSEA